MEVTTLVSAFLVGFYNTKNSVEAAWKYLIICSVGIVLALLGTLMLFSTRCFSSSGLKSLNWTDFMAAAARLDPNMVKIAFHFYYGRVRHEGRAGADAHLASRRAQPGGLAGERAPFGASSEDGDIRHHQVRDDHGHVRGISFSGNMFLIFGLISLAVAAGLILVQKDIKRLLAYSSIEHIGIYSSGCGIGGPIGIYGALFHVFNHAVTKSLMFFGAGNIVSAYNKHKMTQIRGVIEAMPFTGMMFLLGTFAIAGFPPFSIFRSEIMIIMASFLNGSYLAGSLMLSSS